MTFRQHICVIVAYLFVLFPTQVYANNLCSVNEKEVEFEKSKIFIQEYTHYLEQAGVLRKWTLPLMRKAIEKKINLKCAGCSEAQYRAAVARYLSRPYAFANVVISALSASGAAATLLTIPGESTAFMSSMFFVKIALSSVVTGVSVYYGRQASNLLGMYGYKNFFETRTAIDAQRDYPGISRQFAAEVRAGSFTTMEQGMEFPLQRSVGFIHEAARLAFTEITTVGNKQGPSGPSRLFARGIINIIAFHPEFMFAFQPRGSAGRLGTGNKIVQPEVPGVDNPYNPMSNALFAEAIRAEFYRPLFFQGYLKGMQPYLTEGATSNAKVVNFDAKTFREKVIHQIEAYLLEYKIHPLTPKGRAHIEAFLEFTMPNFRDLIVREQLEKPDVMTNKSWIGFLKSKEIPIKFDPYVESASDAIARQIKEPAKEITPEITALANETYMLESGKKITRDMMAEESSRQVESPADSTSESTPGKPAESDAYYYRPNEFKQQ